MNNNSQYQYVHCKANVLSLYKPSYKANLSAGDISEQSAWYKNKTTNTPMPNPVPKWSKLYLSCTLDLQMLDMSATLQGSFWPNKANTLPTKFFTSSSSTCMSSN